MIEAMKLARGVISSINANKYHAIAINGETVFWQREEWVRWALDEVLPELDKAIAEAEKQEPVAWCALSIDGKHIAYFDGKPCIMVGRVGNDIHNHPLHLHPQPKREWVGLTDKEEAELDDKYGDDLNVYIEQRDLKLKEKNGG